MEDIIKTENIDITPDVSLYPKIGKSGYTLTQALAELVDNSIDARTRGTLLTVTVVLQNDFIIVEDDAVGMTKETARKAIILGHSDKRDALGEFGLGLKSACTSLGRKFKIKTYPLGIKEGYLYEYNEDDWTGRKARDDWSDQLRVFEKEEKKHGTYVRIDGLYRKVGKQRKNNVLEDFSRRFAPFIISREVKVIVCQEECKPKEPELTSDGKTNFGLKTIDGSSVRGWYGLMKKGSDRGLYGFSTFRRGRMITSYDKLGIPQHPTVSRIIGEIHLDNVPVAHNKKEFETESEEYKEAVKLLEEEFRELVKKARQTTMASKVTEEVRNKTDIWKEAIIKAFHQSFKEYLNPSTSERKRSYDESDPISQIDIEKRNSPLHETLKEIIKKRERIRNPLDKRQTVTTHFITINGKNYTINHDYARLGVESGWKQYDYFQEKGTIEIFTNEDFPAYAVTSDIPFYAAIHIAESIAEIIGKVENFGMDQINEVKEKMLRTASEIIGDFKL